MWGDSVGIEACVNGGEGGGEGGGGEGGGGKGRGVEFEGGDTGGGGVEAARFDCKDVGGGGEDRRQKITATLGEASVEVARVVAAGFLRNKNAL